MTLGLSPVVAALNAVVPDTTRLVVIHSSLASLRPPGPRAVWEVVQVLRDLAARGVTVAVPTYTFSYCRGKGIDLDTAPSEVGVLGDAFLRTPGVQRTPHPIYSHAVLGPLAAELARCPNPTTWGDGSQFAAFAAHDATVVMLGCGWEYCTYFHRTEEVAHVPYRLFKDFTGPVTHGGTTVPGTARMFVRNLTVDPANDWEPLVARLRQDEAERWAELWGGTVLAAPVRAIDTAAAALLAADPWALVVQPAVARARLASTTTPPLTVAVLGQGNHDLLRSRLGRTLAEVVPERRTSVTGVPFGQLLTTLADPQATCYREPADLTIFADRLEDLLGTALLEDVPPARVAETVAAYAQAITTYAQRVAQPVVVHRFPALGRALRGVADQTTVDGRRALLAQANADLDGRLGPEILRLDPAELGVPLHDLRLWLVGRLAWPPEAEAALATVYARLLLALTGASVRLIVLDLDNTLWGGILGEDGVDGLKLGGDFPGNAFQHLQRVLAQLRRQGVVLALCSKNDHAQALAAIDGLPGMVLRSGDFAATRIGWEEKWRSVAAIAAELNLSPAHVLFVDDNPVEREAMRRHLPQVQVLDLPADPAGYADALLAHPRLGFARLTESDRVRAERYASRAATLAQAATATDPQAFIASLGLTIHLRPVDDGNRARALELLQKTNQFNATTRRHGRAVLDAAQARGDLVVVITVTDRFNPAEDLGLLLVTTAGEPAGQARIDTYLLSCRVLGKGVEGAVIRWLAGICAQRGLTRLMGEIVPTERNAPVRGLYRDLGFTDAGDGRWVVDPATLTPAPAITCTADLPDRILP